MTERKSVMKMSDMNAKLRNTLSPSYSQEYPYAETNVECHATPDQTPIAGTTRKRMENITFSNFY